jgi:alginate biosynthesis protein Alg44
MIIDGKRYRVIDWSVGGCALEADDADELLARRFGVGKMVFRFDHFETAIDELKLEFLYKRQGNIVGCRFTEITPQQVAILNQIISAYIAGDIITKDDIIHAVTRVHQAEPRKVDPGIKKGRSYGVVILLWMVVLALVSFLLYVIYMRAYVVKSENAYIDAKMEVIRAPSPSYIKLSTLVTPGAEINASQQLALARLIYGGYVRIKSPIAGRIFRVDIADGEFRNVGEPIMAILPRRAPRYVVAHILHKYLVKVSIGDKAKVVMPDGTHFVAEVARIESPYDLVAKKAKPLENIYANPRIYDKVYLEPLDHTIDEAKIGMSVSVFIDTFLNRIGYFDADF